MFFLWLIIILFVLVILIATSMVKIEIENLKFTFPKINGKFINSNFKIRLKVYLLKILKVADIELTKIKIEKEDFKERIKKIKENQGKSTLDFDLKIYKILKQINIGFEKIDLKISIGTENAARTAIIIGIISSFISIKFREQITNLKQQKYAIVPNYSNLNILEINYDGIFAINILDIIKSIF